MEGIDEFVMGEGRFVYGFDCIASLKKRSLIFVKTINPMKY